MPKSDNDSYSAIMTQKEVIAELRFQDNPFSYITLFRFI